MRDEHIIAILEQSPASDVNGDERARIEAHIGVCSDCRRAYAAALVAQSLVRARAAETIAAETIEVSPFFKTRVMAAIREQRLTPEMPSLLRLWKAASALVSAMVVVLVVLTGLTVFSGSDDVSSPSPSTAIAVTEPQSLYLGDYLAFEPGGSSDEAMPYDQVFETVYEAEEGDGN